MSVCFLWLHVCFLLACLIGWLPGRQIAVVIHFSRHENSVDVLSLTIKIDRTTAKKSRSKNQNQSNSRCIHSGRLTWNLQITHLQRKMIFQTSMIMVHVNLPGRTANQTNSNTSDHHDTSPIPTFPNRKVVFQPPFFTGNRIIQLGMLKNTKQKTIQNHQTKTAPPKFNIAPENRESQRKLIFQPSIFRGELLNFQGVNQSKQNPKIQNGSIHGP